MVCLKQKIDNETARAPEVVKDGVFLCPDAFFDELAADLARADVDRR